MGKTVALVLLCLVNCCATLEIGIYGGSFYIVKPGEQRTFTCHVNQGLEVILSYDLMWTHVSLVDPSNPKETILTKQQTLEYAAADSDLYAVDVNYGSATLNNTLTLKNVQPTSDGKYICRARPQSGETGLKPVEAEIDVIVVSDVQSVKMVFDGGVVVTREDPTPVEREQGDSYGVTCEASGFNPTASIRIFLGEQELNTGSPVIVRDPEASAAAGARRYRATASATNVRLSVSDSGKKLRCQAKADYAEDAATLVASVPLNVTSKDSTGGAMAVTVSQLAVIVLCFCLSSLFSLCTDH